MRLSSLASLLVVTASFALGGCAAEAEPTGSGEPGDPNVALGAPGSVIGNDRTNDAVQVGTVVDQSAHSEKMGAGSRFTPLNPYQLGVGAPPGFLPFSHKPKPDSKGPNTFSIGGYVTGLVRGARLTLQINEAHDVEVDEDGEFSFPTELVKGVEYEARVVKVSRVPEGSIVDCSVDGARGLLADANVTEMRVVCETTCDVGLGYAKDVSGACVK